MKISDLQSALVDQIKQLDGFSKIEVLSENRGDLVSEVATAMAKIGMAVIVLTPSAKNDQPEKAAINLALNVTIQVSENAALNRSESGSGLAAIDAAIVIARGLHYFQAGEFARLNFEGLELVEDTPDLVYHLIFSTRTSLR